MKKIWVLIIGLSIFLLVGCGVMTSEEKDRAIVQKQQSIYQAVQPVHIYDFSIPRDIYQQIYDITTTEVVATYTIIESVTGVTRYEGPSIGYAIPADVSLTNPLQPAYHVCNSGIIEQAEPNGLFSSKNTDGTWVLYVDLKSGEVYPVYSEHKVTTFPFIVKKNEKGQWIRADDKPLAFKINIRKGVGKPPVVK
jgi:hypothetical protein